MSIEKKSLISTLKTAKKANVAKEDFAAAGTMSSGVKSPGKHIVAGRTLGRATTAGRTLGRATTAGRTLGRATTAGRTSGRATTAGRKQ